MGPKLGIKTAISTLRVDYDKNYDSEDKIRELIGNLSIENLPDIFTYKFNLDYTLVPKLTIKSKGELTASGEYPLKILYKGKLVGEFVLKNVV